MHQTSSQGSQSGENNKFLEVLTRAFPDVLSYETQENVIQANAEGARILATFKTARTVTDQDQPPTKELFVKSIEAPLYSHKPWADLRRSLLYVRTEVRFYNEFLTCLRERIGGNKGWPIAPECHLAECNLDGLIDQHESTITTADSTVDSADNTSEPLYSPQDSSALQGKGGYIILDSMEQKKGKRYYQESPLTISQARLCLDAIARCHAATFQDVSLLKRASNRLSEHGGSYHLSIRNPKELENIENSWRTFIKAFSGHVPKGFFDKPSIQSLGKRVKKAAPYVSFELSPRAEDACATIVHGDFKAMNVFLPVETGDDRNGGKEDFYPILIDFASAGLGLGMSDVAMHITHAVLPKDLECGGENSLVKGYLKSFEDALPMEKKGSYTVEAAMRHYKLATIDYFRFIVGRFWRSASIEKFEKRKHSKNSTLVNRNLDAAIAFVKRADQYLSEFEKEMRERVEGGEVHV